MMIRDPQAVEAAEIERMRRTPVDYERNFAIFESMLEHAIAMGAMPVQDPLYGIEAKIRLAKAMNEVAANRARERT